MSAIFSQPTAPASRAGVNLVSSHQHSEICCHCGADLPLANPEYEFIEVVCRSCGMRKSDVAIFYLIENDTGHLASPQFATLGQVETFAEFFQIQIGQGYDILKAVRVFTPARQEAKQSVLAEPEQASCLLERLFKLPADKKHPADLPYIACAAGLFGYALPQFREGYGDEGVA